MTIKMNGKILSIILFSLLLVSLPVITLAIPKQEYSETENRTLKAFPSLSFNKIINRDFMDGFETYFSDHFVLRDSWITLKSNTEYTLGKRENNNIFIGEDQLIENIPEPDNEVVDKNIEAIKAFAEKTGLTPTLMLVPTAASVLADKLPMNVPTWNQQEFIEAIYENLADTCKTVDVLSSLMQHKEDYIYYRTDHHWTTLGAYYGYREYCLQTGIEPFALSGFSAEHASNDFNGTLYSKSGCRNITPDTIDFYSINYYSSRMGSKVLSLTVDRLTETKGYDSLYFREYLEAKDKYSAFLGPNEAHINIKTDNESGKKLLIFKDSYAHCLIPFLSNHYSEIDIIDLRYVNFYYTDYIGETRYDDVLLLYNSGTFADDTTIAKIGRLE